jgi:tryptophanyl-tRNA synthetase
MYCKGSSFKKRCKAAGIPSFPTFVEPEAMIVSSAVSEGRPSGAARVMSLTDGTSKMSKSDPNDFSRINILDPPDVIRDKIKRCKTDAFRGLEWDNPQRPEATNLLTIYSAVQPTPRSKEEILSEVQELSWGEFKPILADAIVAHLDPIQDKYRKVREDEKYLLGVLKDGADEANQIASKTLQSARVAMGFTSRSL